MRRILAAMATATTLLAVTACGGSSDEPTGGTASGGTGARVAQQVFVSKHDRWGLHGCTGVTRSPTP